MGASISVTTANLTMEFIEQKPLQSFHTSLKWFLRYVDNCFCILEKRSEPVPDAPQLYRARHPIYRAPYCFSMYWWKGRETIWHLRYSGSQLMLDAILVLTLTTWHVVRRWVRHSFREWRLFANPMLTNEQTSKPSLPIVRKMAIPTVLLTASRTAQAMLINFYNHKKAQSPALPDASLSPTYKVLAKHWHGFWQKKE